MLWSGRGKGIKHGPDCDLQSTWPACLLTAECGVAAATPAEPDLSSPRRVNQITGRGGIKCSPDSTILVTYNLPGRPCGACLLLQSLKWPQLPLQNLT